MVVVTAAVGPCERKQTLTILQAAATFGYLAPQGGAMQILLVEDEPLIAALIEEQLGWAGHLVKIAPTGATALRLFLDGYPRADMLVVEARLPDMSAWDVLATCRSVVPGLPAVILSDEPARDFRVADYVVTLQRPFTDDALFVAIRAAVAGPNA